MLEQITVNNWAVLVSAIAAMVVGSLWYGPLFGSVWMRLVGLSKDDANKGNMGQLYFGAFVGALVMAYVLAHVLAFAGAETVSDGLQGALWMWLGFPATILLSGILWLGKPTKLYMIDAGYYLALLLVMGAILGGWR